MTATLKNIVFLVLFFGLLGSTFLLREHLPGTAAQERLERGAAVEKYGFCLQEVAKECGIDFMHKTPTLDARLTHIMPIVASMGASVSVVDYNKDGWPDLYVINSGEGSRNALYRNNRDGTFTDVAEEMGLADLNRAGDGVCMGAVWGDYDNDGYEDVLIYRWGKPELYHNDEGKRFTRVTEKAGLPKRLNANSAVWLDFDGDGLLDLFIAGYWADDIDLWNLKDTKIMPESFQYANNGGSKFLLRNRGDGTFEDVTAKVGIDSKRWTLGVAATDLRGTGYPDIVLANDYGVNEFYANLGGKKFVEIGKATGVGEQSKSGMSAVFGDIFNDGRFSIYVSNITQPGILLQWNNLWVPMPDKNGAERRYENLADTLGVAQGQWSWGAQFGDLNNDGRLDLFLANGYISARRSQEYWYDYSFIAGALSPIISDASKWPPMKNRSLGGYQSSCVWINKRGKFDDIAAAIGVTETYDGRAVALVDLWNRGVLDVVVANQKGPLLVYKNTVAADRDWVQFELRGTRSNCSAIGAQVTLYWKDQVQIQEVSGGNGYASQNQRPLHFGLGKDARIDRAEIRWPSGQTQTITAPKARPAPNRGAVMSTDANGRPAANPQAAKKGGWFNKAKPFLAPLLITCILIAGNLKYNFLEGHWGTAAAIATAILAELVLSLFASGRWPHIASAYITGISVGILLRTPLLWPYIICTLLSISSKYALRINGRHLWNPSNLGVSVMLFLAPRAAAPLSQQWGNEIWVPLIILGIGSLILYMLGRLHITLTYIVAFVALSFVRIGITHGDWGVVPAILSGDAGLFSEWVSQIALLTAPSYLLFMIFMITDPKTTTRGWIRQCSVAVLVAVAETILRLNREIHAPYYALFIVAPITNFLEIAWDWAHPRPTKPVARPSPTAADTNHAAPNAEFGKVPDSRIKNLDPTPPPRLPGPGGVPPPS